MWAEEDPLEQLFFLILSRTCARGCARDLVQEMGALLQRVMAGREEQKKQRQMDLERLLQR